MDVSALLIKLGQNPDFCGMNVEKHEGGWTVDLEWWNGDSDRWTTTKPTIAECFAHLRATAELHGWIREDS